MKDIKKKREFDRQTAVKKNIATHRRRRKANYALYYVVVGLFVVALLCVLSLTVFFTVKQIGVEGSSPYPSEEIIQKSGVSLQENLVRLDCTTAEKKILESFIEIDGVKVLKKFPSDVVIKVEKAVPAVILESGGKYVTFSKKYKVLRIDLEKPDLSVPLIKGVLISPNLEVGSMLGDELKKEKETIETLRQNISTANLSNITEYDLSNLVDITIIYDNRIRIKLGTMLQLDYKLSFARYILEESGDVGPNIKGTIDATVTGRPTFREEKEESGASSNVSQSSSAVSHDSSSLANTSSG